MLPARQTIDRYNVLSTTNDNSPPFLTVELQGLMELLACNRSLAMLSGFLTGVLGVNTKMESYPYMGILLNNLKLTASEAQTLTHSPCGHYNKVWTTEVLCRVLFQVAGQRIEDIQLENLARGCAAKIREMHSKMPSYGLYSPRSILCIDELSAYLQRVGIQQSLNMRMISDSSLSILDDMAQYFASAGCEEFCLLLTFYGAKRTYVPETRSSDLVRNILSTKGRIPYTPARGLPVRERDARRQISEVMATHLEQAQRDLECAEAIVRSQYPWYAFYRRLVQLFCSALTVPKLKKAYETLRRLDVAYRDSVTYGDCAQFFSELREIEESDRNCCAKHSGLFSTLRAVQGWYQVATHAEYVAEVQNCMSRPTPVPLASLTLSDSAQDMALKRINRKVCERIGKLSKWIKRTCHVSSRTSNRATPLESYLPQVPVQPAQEVRSDALLGAGVNAMPVAREDAGAASLPRGELPRLQEANLRKHVDSGVMHNARHTRSIENLASAKKRPSSIGMKARYLTKARAARYLLLGNSTASHPSYVKPSYRVRVAHDGHVHNRISSLYASSEHLTSKEEQCTLRTSPELPVPQKHAKKKRGVGHALKKRLREVLRAGPKGTLSSDNDNGRDALNRELPAFSQSPASLQRKQKCSVGHMLGKHLSKVLSTKTKTVHKSPDNDNCCSAKRKLPASTQETPVLNRRKRLDDSGVAARELHRRCTIVSGEMCYPQFEEETNGPRRAQAALSDGSTPHEQRKHDIVANGADALPTDHGPSTAGGILFAMERPGID
ncbi:MAG: hypothetical protein ACTJLL_01780 [Anaplasma sp.]